MEEAKRKLTKMRNESIGINKVADYNRHSVLVAEAGNCSEDHGKRIREMIFSSYPYIKMEEDYGQRI